MMGVFFFVHALISSYGGGLAALWQVCKTLPYSFPTYLQWRGCTSASCCLHFPVPFNVSQMKIETSGNLSVFYTLQQMQFERKVDSLISEHCLHILFAQV